MSRSGRSKPGRKCLRQLWVREVSRPGDMSVGSDQHGRGSSDLAKDREAFRDAMLIEYLDGAGVKTPRP
jgi:hypothetical protein